MLIYLDSADCIDLHPTNTPSCFEIQMPDCLIAKEYQKAHGRWFLALVDITVPPIYSSKLSKYDVIYVLCDQVISSAKGDAYWPILRQVVGGEIKRNNFVRYPSLLHIPVSKTELKRFTIRLTDSRGDLIQWATGNNSNNNKASTKCTLDLIWSNIDRQL